MQIKDILHGAVRTMDPAATRRFYRDILGLKVDVNRPDSVPAPGIWLDFGERSQVHVIEGPKAYGPVDHATRGGGNIDHMAVRAVGYDA
jgi:catechol 2,3-dioxygenase-like lactoylglutathione lyase family enzyme